MDIIGKPYRPSHWYWVVADNEARVYHTGAVNDYVPADNADYLKWLSDGSRPTRINSEDELGEVLAQVGVRPVHAAILDSYLTVQARKIVALKEFALLLDHENRLRTVERALGLNGNPANLSAAQMFGRIKAFVAAMADS